MNTIPVMIHNEEETTYAFGQQLTQDVHFNDHHLSEVPVQIYLDNKHEDIGFIQSYNNTYVIVNNTYYNRTTHCFVSRPGY